MKMFAFAILIVVSFSAAADNSNPIVVKSSNTGYVLEAYVYQELCQVFVDKVVIQKTWGVEEKKTTLTETIDIQLQGDMKLISTLASKEPVTKKR